MGAEFVVEESALILDELVVFEMIGADFLKEGEAVLAGPAQATSFHGSFN